MQPQLLHTDTICALSTASGMGAIAVLRLSGDNAIAIANKIFTGTDLGEEASHTLHVGSIKDGEELIDEVVIGLFREPSSYSGEDVVEISCHGSTYIQQAILNLLVKEGARLAEPGEFTKRAFLNGKMDLSQTEAVADLIASESAAAHKVALCQMRGGYSEEIRQLREELVNFTSLIELELDFSEEDVEFADRSKLDDLLNKIQTTTQRLINSFKLGNVLKTGVPVVIAGKPNVGKSTLLNTLLKEDRAIVSEVPGTTRDTVEDQLNLNGITFRFIDTAGIRETDDKLEAMGVARTLEKIRTAAVVLYLFDATNTSKEEIEAVQHDLRPTIEANDSLLLLILNKTDQQPGATTDPDLMPISAMNGENIETITEALLGWVENAHTGDTLVTNARHLEALTKAHEAVANVQKGMKEAISGDLLAQDIRLALHYLGEITGEVTTDEILGNIFGRFCIGK